MEYKNLSFVKRLNFAMKGIRATWNKEASLRFQFFAAIALTVFCIVIRPPFLWCAIFAGMSALVISLEMVNSAVEAVLDRIHPQYDEKIGFAKDCLAGAVLVASLTSILVFLLFIGSVVF